MLCVICLPKGSPLACRLSLAWTRLLPTGNPVSHNSPLPWWPPSCTPCFKLPPGPVPAAPPPWRPWLGSEVSWSLFPAGVGCMENDLRGWGSRGGRGVLRGCPGGLGWGSAGQEACSEHSARNPQDSVMKGAFPFPAPLQPLPSVIQPCSCLPCTLGADGGPSGSGAPLPHLSASYTQQEDSAGGRYKGLTLLIASVGLSVGSEVRALGQEWKPDGLMTG